MNYTALVSDSRKVKPGCLFFCKGKNFKREYLVSAIENGAAAYVAECDYNVEIPYIPTSDIRDAMADFSKDYYKDPSSSLMLAGFTGTKGKSTALYFLKSIMECTDICGEGGFGYISSIDNYDGNNLVESHLTTPEAIELNELLASMVENGIKYAGMEVSSQALKYKRNKGLSYKIGCFTNFGKDHISPDEHSDLEDYFSSKLKLIPMCEEFIVNADSDRSEAILEACRASADAGTLKKVFVFESFLPESNKESFPSEKLKSIFKECKLKPIWISAENIEKTPAGTSFDLDSFGRLLITLPGFFNVDNAVVAAIMAREMGADTEAVKLGLRNARVKGRMEIYSDKDASVVGIVDFAHNELAFKKIFESVKSEYKGYRIEAIFGCPGNKAYERRKELPAVAAENADFCYITEDDPYNENVSDICSEVYDNLLLSGGKGCIILNREEAAKTAIRNAKSRAKEGEKTLILFLAKGQDKYMHRKTFEPYVSDSKLAEDILNE